MGNKNTGSKGEAMAVSFLEQAGFEIMERNWRFGHWEVDIIAARNERLHFVEVKTRTTEYFGKPEESIGHKKMRNLRNAAEEYQYLHPEWKYLQFDVVAILLRPSLEPEIFYIEDVYF